MSLWNIDVLFFTCSEPLPGDAPLPNDPSESWGSLFGGNRSIGGTLFAKLEDEYNQGKYARQLSTYTPSATTVESKCMFSSDVINLPLGFLALEESRRLTIDTFAARMRELLFDFDHQYEAHHCPLSIWHLRSYSSKLSDYLLEWQHPRLLLNDLDHSLCIGGDNHLTLFVYVPYFFALKRVLVKRNSLECRNLGGVLSTCASPWDMPPFCTRTKYTRRKRLLALEAHLLSCLLYSFRISHQNNFPYPLVNSGMLLTPERADELSYAERIQSCILERLSHARQMQQRLPASNFQRRQGAVWHYSQVHRHSSDGQCPEPCAHICRTLILDNIEDVMVQADAHVVTHFIYKEFQKSYHCAHSHPDELPPLVQYFRQHVKIVTTMLNKTTFWMSMSNSCVSEKHMQCYRKAHAHLQQELFVWQTRERLFFSFA